MIVRIATEGQYELLERDEAALEDLDRKAVAACDGGDEQQFHDAFATLLDFVRSNGQRVPDDQLAASDLILPPPDITLEEARQEFTGDGLIPS